MDKTNVYVPGNRYSFFSVETCHQKICQGDYQEIKGGFEIKDFVTSYDDSPNTLV